MLTVRIQVIDGTGTFTLSDSQPCRLLTSLHRSYPASAVLRTSPPPQGARPVPHGHPVGHPCPRLGVSRVAYAFLVYMLSPLPRRSGGRTLRSASPSRISLPRKGCRVGLRIVLFEVCSAFTRVTACTRALSPIRDTLTRGFSHFVTSMTAPVASGWSSCRVDLHPLESAAFPRRTPILDFAPNGVCGVGATSRWPLDRKVLGRWHRLTAPSETPGDAANSLPALSQPMRLGLINHRSSYAFIEF